MSNDQLMTKREMGGEQGAAVSSPPSLGLRRNGLSDSTTDDTDDADIPRMTK
jgi:hypothetical protein